MRRIILSFIGAAVSVTALAQPTDWNVQYILQKDYGRPSNVNPRRIDIPGIDGYKAMKCDLHMHTINSDGYVTPSIRVEEAWLEGLDAIAITDHQPYWNASDTGHDYDKSYKQAESLAKAKGVTLIRGMEISHSDNEIGHINVLFIKDCNDYKIPKVFNRKDTHEALVQARAEGAFVTGNHPGWPDENSDLGKFWIDEITSGNILGMEIFNAFEFYPLAIDHVKKYGLAAIGASDEHRPMSMCYGDKFRPMTIVFAKSNSVEDIKEALFARRTLAMANGIVAGNATMLLKLFRACVKLDLVEKRGNKSRVRIYNDSDIDFVLDCGQPSKMVRLPAHRYYDDEVRNVDLGLVYKVVNMMVSSTECLEIPLSMITTPQSDIDSPIVDEKGVSYGKDGSVNIPLMCEQGQTWWTIDGSEPSAANGTLYNGPVTVKGSCTLKAKTVNGDKSSYVYEYPLLYLNAQNVKAKKHGLDYAYYDDPAPRSITSVKMLTPERLRSRGVAEMPSLQNPAQEDWYGYIFEGYLSVPESGIYTFMLDTDDGSQLYLDGQLIVDIDYNLGNSVGTGYCYLEAGLHEFRMPYFEGHYSEKIVLSWTRPGASSYEVIPASAFFRK